MAESQCFYVVLLIFCPAVLLYGSEVKSVCNGDSVRLFNSIQINTSDTIVSLYRNSEKHRIIASWNVDGTTISHENTNLFQDERKNIWLIDVHLSDGGKYVLQYDVGTNKTWKVETELSVLLSPKPTCKPMIVQSGMILKASLRDNDCGTPKPSVYWQQYPNVDYEGDELIRLHSGIEAGTYYACIKGPAVRCTDSSSPSLDHCTAITVKDSSIQPVTGSSEVQRDSGGNTITLLTMVALILLLQILFAVYHLYIKFTQVKKTSYSQLAVFELNARNQGTQN